MIVRVQKSQGQGFVFHSHPTTLTVIRLVVPGTLIGTPVVSTAQSPAFTKPASGVYAHRQTACPIPCSIMVAAGQGRDGRIREQWGVDRVPEVREEVRPAAARSTILTDNGIAGWCEVWKRPIIDFVRL